MGDSEFLLEPETVQEFSPAKALKEAFWKLKESRVRISPAHSTRASSIGEPCDRMIYYQRTAGEMATPYAPGLQAIFDLGKALETYVFREIEAMGVQVVQRERDYFDREYEITGRVDGRIIFPVPGWDEPIPGEIKGLNPYTADSIRTIMDIRESRQHWVQKYYDQLQTYIYFEKSKRGIFILLNKVSGEIEFVDCPRDDSRIAELLAKAARIRDAVRSNTPPPRSESENCERCPFAHLCLPDIHFGPGVQILDSEELEALIARKLELAEVTSEVAAIDRELKKRLPETPELVIGDFLVKAKQVHRDGYTVGPSDYWQRKFTTIKTKGVH